VSNVRSHIAEDQPLAHLFTVSMDELHTRLSSGGKYVGKPKPKTKEKK